MEIRAGEPQDAAFFADTWRAMLDELALASDGVAPDWRDRLTEYFAAGIADGSQGWFVAVRDSDRLGAAAAFLRRSVVGEIQHRRTAVLAGVYVAPACRRNGLARELVIRTIEWARRQGCTEVRLQTSAAAEHLYRSLGFKDDAGLILSLD